MRVVVIGAGISGPAMGIRLKRAGIEDFKILDAAEGLGGTWRINTYPGAAVDIASIIFQFGFRTHPWRRTHARQAAWVIADLKRMKRRKLTAIDTRESACTAYNTWLQRRLQRTVWAQSNNYFKHPSGRIVTRFDGSITLQWVLLKLGRPLGSYGIKRKAHR